MKGKRRRIGREGEGGVKWMGREGVGGCEVGGEKKTPGTALSLN
jgi:hypothetical protein